MTAIPVFLQTSLHLFYPLGNTPSPSEGLLWRRGILRKTKFYEKPGWVAE
jgi:hypothetical protein